MVETRAVESSGLRSRASCLAARSVVSVSTFFFFNDTATTEIYTLSLHDALPIWHIRPGRCRRRTAGRWRRDRSRSPRRRTARSEEHTSELQSQSNLVCRLLLEKKRETVSGSSSSPRITASASEGSDFSPCRFTQI